MRARLLATATVVIVASPATAADLSGGYIPPAGDPVYAPGPMVVGHLSLGVGVLNDDGLFGVDDDTIGVFSGAGRANVSLGGPWNLQFETGGQALFNDGSSLSTVGVAGHLWTRLNSSAVGVFGSADFPSGATVGTVGVEGETYFGNVTLGADASYSWSDNIGDFWRVGGWADYYFTPDLRFGGAVDYGAGDIPDTWSAGIDTEYRLPGTPFSVWGEVSYSNVSGGGGDVDIWSGLLGLRVFMDGGGTLQQHDRDVPWEGLLSTQFRF
jgi:hypothetical protein